MTIAKATAPDIFAEWERCKPWLEAALEYDGGHYGIDDVWHEIASGNAHFWPGKRSAVVSQFWNFPNAKCINYWLAGGDLREMLDDMQPVVEAWARSHGCTEVIVAGREGWVRVLKQHGFSPVWTALRKNLVPKGDE